MPLRPPCFELPKYLIRNLHHNAEVQIIPGIFPGAPAPREVTRWRPSPTYPGDLGSQLYHSAAADMAMQSAPATSPSQPHLNEDRHLVQARPHIQHTANCNTTDAHLQTKEHQQEANELVMKAWLVHLVIM